jgi:Fe-S-cluster containining protein
MSEPPVNRSMNARQREQALRNLYRTLPKIACQGKCQASCGPISMATPPHEAARVELKGKRKLTTKDGVNGALTCSMLGEDGRCTVHPHRPGICRLWGLVPQMRCPHNCEVTPGMLTDDEGHAFIRKLIYFGGNPLTVFNR